jgi:hypothetical protein
MNEATKNLVNNVLGELSEEGFFSSERFLDSAVQEVNTGLQELGVFGNLRRFALVKFRQDLTTNYEQALNEQGKAELVKLSPLERFKLLAPAYTGQLLDEEVSKELIEVWIEQLCDGEVGSCPKAFPAALYNMVKATDPAWAEHQMDDNDPAKNVLFNRELLHEALYKAGLI